VGDVEGLRSSPFQVKGLLYQGTRTYFDSCVEGGYETLLTALRPPLRAFMEQPFVAGARYEVMLVPELLEIEAQVARQRMLDYLQARTHFQARQDLRGIYRLMVRVAPTPIVVKRVAVVMGQMFNFGASRVEKEGPTQLRIGFRGVPDALAPWLEQCLSTYGEVALGLAAASEARCQAGPRTPAEPVEGYPTSNLSVDVSWA
jgi:hypothetical protein